MLRKKLAEEAKRGEREGDLDTGGGKEETPKDGSKVKEPPRARRFHGSVTLNPVRLGRDASDMANEIVQHLTKQPGAKVEITLEILRLKFQMGHRTTWYERSTRIA